MYLFYLTYCFFFFSIRLKREKHIFCLIVSISTWNKQGFPFVIFQERDDPKHEKLSISLIAAKSKLQQVMHFNYFSQINYIDSGLIGK